MPDKRSFEKAVLAKAKTLCACGCDRRMGRRPGCLYATAACARRGAEQRVAALAKNKS